MRLQHTRALGKTFALDIPLHPDTRSCEDVATLVEGFLKSIDSYGRNAQGLAQGDVLQALSIVTAVQMAKSEAAERYGSGLQIRLEDLSIEATSARV